MLIYKIFRTDEWNLFQNMGQTAGSEVDVRDGYIHFSTAAQAPQTAAKWFAREDDLVLAACSADRLNDHLKWETARQGDLFPHYYGILKMDDVLWHEPLRSKDGVHVFPEAMA